MHKIFHKIIITVVFVFSSFALSVHAEETANEITTKVAAASALANVPGHSLTAVEVTVPPGVGSPAHKHAGFVFVYVLEGIVESQLNNGEIQLFKAGESWVEPPGTLHSHTKNPSETETAKVLAVFVAEDNAQLTTMEEHSN